MILSSIFEKSGEYSGAFLVAIILAGLGLLLTIVYRLLVKKQNKN